MRSELSSSSTLSVCIDMGPPAIIDYDVVSTFDHKNIIDKFRPGVNPKDGVGFPIFVRLLNNQKPGERCVFQTDDRPQVSIVDSGGEVIKTVSFKADGTAKFDQKSIIPKNWKVHAF